MALDTPGCEVCSALAALRQVEVAAHRFLDKAELVEIHTQSGLKQDLIMPVRG